MPMPKAVEPAPKVLVVDDVPGNRAILCRRLSRIGYECIEADSGEAALHILGRMIPDIVLLDYMMPEMSGIDLLRAIKMDDRTRAVPVIMVTARTEGEAIAEALDAGAEDYVTKPINFTGLEARMKNVLQRKYASSDLRKINQALDGRIVQRSLELAEAREELLSERTRCSFLESEINAHGDASWWCNRNCREGNLRILERMEQILEAMAEHLEEGRPVNGAMLSEARAGLAVVRHNMQLQGSS